MGQRFLFPFFSLESCAYLVFADATSSARRWSTSVLAKPVALEYHAWCQPRVHTSCGRTPLVWSRYDAAFVVRACALVVCLGVLNTISRMPPAKVVPSLLTEMFFFVVVFHGAGRKRSQGEGHWPWWYLPCHPVSSGFLLVC